MDFTIINNTRGYHGHQIKDLLGGRCIGELYDLNYLASRYPYLDQFALNRNMTAMSWWKRHFGYKQVRRVPGPLWDGISDYEAARSYFAEAFDVPDQTLLIFEQALRIHPHQTIPWYESGKIKTNIWRKLVNQTSQNYREIHPSITPTGPVRVAMHVSRGADYNRERFPEHFEDSYNVRYMVPMEYFVHIAERLIDHIGGEDIIIDVYTESQNSEDIVGAFAQMSQATVHIGSNRKQKNHHLIHAIFGAFVKADVLVACNSSFSAMCSYFRAGKTTIYHPHRHLDHLPAPEFIATDTTGYFDVNQLKLIRS